MQIELISGYRSAPNGFPRGRCCGRCNYLRFGLSWPDTNRRGFFFLGSSGGTSTSSPRVSRITLAKPTASERASPLSSTSPRRSVSDWAATRSPRRHGCSWRSGRYCRVAVLPQRQQWLGRSFHHQNGSLPCAPRDPCARGFLGQIFKNLHCILTLTFFEQYIGVGTRLSQGRRELFLAHWGILGCTTGNRQCPSQNDCQRKMFQGVHIFS